MHRPTGTLRFIFLGWLFTRRNLQRNLLSVFSLAIATATLISAASLATGSPGSAQLTERRFIGGDILVLPHRVAGPGTTPQPGSRWQWQAPGFDEGALLAEIFPHWWEAGILLDSLQFPVEPSSLLNIPGVREVVPVRALPALAHLGQTRAWVLLRDRHSNEGMYALDSLVTAGRSLLPADRGAALFDGFRADYATTNDVFYGYDRFNGVWAVLEGPVPTLQPLTPPAIDSTVALEVPRYRGEVSGRPLLDYSAGVIHDVTVVGHYQARTGHLPWGAYALRMDGLQPVSRGEPPTGQPNPFLSEPLVWTSRQVMLPPDLLDDLAKAAGLLAGPPIAYYAVRVDDYSRVEVVTEQIRNDLGLTAFSAAQAAGLRDLASTPVFRLPQQDAAGLHQGGDPPVQPLPTPSWVRWLMVTLIYLLSGLMLSGNVYILLTLRRTEIAILQALGATPGQVAVTIGTEILLVGLVGAVSGFVLLLPALLWQWSSVVGLTGTLVTRLLLVGLAGGGAAVACCALFGGVPAWRVIRRSPMEVLRGA